MQKLFTITGIRKDNNAGYTLNTSSFIDIDRAHLRCYEVFTRVHQPLDLYGSLAKLSERIEGMARGASREAFPLLWNRAEMLFTLLATQAQKDRSEGRIREAQDVEMMLENCHQDFPAFRDLIEELEGSVLV